MSKMSDLAITICEMYRKGYSVGSIAKIVGVPVDWVLGALKYSL